MRYFSFLFFLIITIQASSQTKYLNGLIVTQTNDTIMCLVPAASSFGKKITIKRAASGAEESIPVSSIRYLATAFNVFENVSFNQQGETINKLMLLKVEGKINLYVETVYSAGYSGPHIRGVLPLSNAPARTYAIRKTDTSFLVEEDNFIQIIAPLVSDNEPLRTRVASGAYKYEDIETIVREYDSLPEPAVPWVKSPVPTELFTDKKYKKIVAGECDGHLFTKTETAPAIKGGEEALADSLSIYLSNHTGALSGKATFVFLLTKNAELLDIEKLSGSITKEKNFKEALLAYAGCWVPALQNGRPVCAVVQLEVEFEKARPRLRILVGAEQ